MAIAQDCLSEVTNLLKQRFPNLLLVYLFGSQVDGTASAGSDVDLAFLDYSPTLPPMAQLQLQGQIADFLGVDAADLIDLARASDVMRLEVIKNGKVLYERSQDARDAFEMLALSSYVRLNDQRKDLLDEFYSK